MRYFLTTNASRQFKVAGMTLIFELTENIGSTWRGVLAVADEAAASALAAALPPQITEITLEEYEAQKKTVRPTSSSRFSVSPEQRLPSPRPLGPVAVVGGNTTAPAASQVAAPTPVELKTINLQIVDELALAPTVAKPRAA